MITRFYASKWICLFLSCGFLNAASPVIISPIDQTPFTPKDYSSLIGMPGFDEKPLLLHFKLYQGYVNRTNELLTLLKDFRLNESFKSPCYADIKRRLMWEYDGMRLHEYYFDNLVKGGKPLPIDSELYRELVAEFGSYKNWEEDFKATGAMRGIGWAVLVRDPLSGRLTNSWINEHDHGHLTGGTPILVMDVFEHAYMLQWGLDRAQYIQAFFNNIDWTVAMHRMHHAS